MVAPASLAWRAAGFTPDAALVTPCSVPRTRRKILRALPDSVEESAPLKCSRKPVTAHPLLDARGYAGAAPFLRLWIFVIETLWLSMKLPVRFDILLRGGGACSNGAD